ncbi:MAG: FAD-binding oxidoreductase [Proteobacteria bacterium]|nr:FAD-binding oxidoreductase [Pseudomonadota bacterium]
MSLKKQIEQIVGSANVLDDPVLQERYVADQSFVRGSTPDIVVRPHRVEEIQGIVRLANRVKIPITPFSSGLNLHGAALPSRGGMVLDLTGMDTIIEVNEKDWYAVIEPGVTYEALQNAVAKKGLRLMVPFGVPPQRSVLTSYLERDVVMAAAHQEYGNYLILDTELVLPEGDLLRTGCWNLGGRPGGLYGPGLNMLYKLWTGSQGTLGIFTKLIMSVQQLSPQRQFFFIPLDTAERIPEVIKRIQEKEIGWECFGLNRFNLAALLNDEWEVPRRFPVAPKPSARFAQIQKSLPAWTLIIGLSGLPYFPEERIAYEEEELRKLCSELNVSVAAALPGFPAMQEIFLTESLRPWGVLRKFNFKGSVHDLSFKVPLHRFPAIETIVSDAARNHGYPTQDLGGYFVVMERGRGIHCEFDLHADPHSAAEKKKTRTLWLAASASLMDSGALFDRPYGDWAAMVYARAPEYALKLKQIKHEMDPQGILNPGKLCF